LRITIEQNPEMHPSSRLMAFFKSLHSQQGLGNLVHSWLPWLLSRECRGFSAGNWFTLGSRKVILALTGVRVILLLDSVNFSCLLMQPLLPDSYYSGILFPGLKWGRLACLSNSVRQADSVTFVHLSNLSSLLVFSKILNWCFAKGQKKCVVFLWHTALVSTLSAWPFILCKVVLLAQGVLTKDRLRNFNHKHFLLRIWRLRCKVRVLAYWVSRVLKGPFPSTCTQLTLVCAAHGSWQPCPPHLLTSRSPVTLYSEVFLWVWKRVEGQARFVGNSCLQVKECIQTDRSEAGSRSSSYPVRRLMNYTWLWNNLTTKWIQLVSNQTSKWLSP
jgi:hypothetical protein